MFIMVLLGCMDLGKEVWGVGASFCHMVSGHSLSPWLPTAADSLDRVTDTALVRFLHCQGSLPPPLPVALSIGALAHMARRGQYATHPPGLSVQIYHVNFFCMGYLSLLSHLLVYSTIYYYPLRIVGIHHTLWVRSQFCVGYLITLLLLPRVLLLVACFLLTNSVTLVLSTCSFCVWQSPALWFFLFLGEWLVLYLSQPL